MHKRGRRQAKKEEGDGLRLLLLLPTTTYRASAFLRAAQRLGIEVVVGSDQRQALPAPGRALTLNFLRPESAVADIVDFAGTRPLRAVVGVDDEGVLLAALASEALGLPHNSAASVRATQHKHEMRALLARAGLPSPGYRVFSMEDDPAEVCGSVPYPCVLKPVFLSASRGVIRADGPEAFVAAFRRIVAILAEPRTAARGGEAARTILVEDYIRGGEVALEGLLVKGDLKTLALFDKPDPLEGPFFEETLYVTPSRLPGALQEEIGRQTSEAARAVGLREGPVHAELRFNEAGVWVVEVAARSIGGLCSRALRFGTGMSLEEVILRHATGLPMRSLRLDRRAAGVMMMPIPGRGVLKEVRGLEAARQTPGVEGVTITVPPGRKVVPLPEGDRYLGFIFARGGTPDGVEEALREAYRRMEVVIE
jgi:biotin carboxylase